jgi:predicted secreted protein
MGRRFKIITVIAIVLFSLILVFMMLGDSGKDNISISLNNSEKLESGNYYSIAVEKNNNSFDDVQVRLDGDVIGETDSQGELIFKAPRKEDINVSINYKQQIYSKGFQINRGSTENEEYRIEKLAPGSLEVGSEFTAEFNFEAPRRALYSVYFGGERIIEEQFEGSAVFEEDLSWEGDNGTLVVEITKAGVNQHSKQYVLRYEGDQSSNRPEPSINITNLHPKQESIDSKDIEFGFTLSSDTSGNYDVFLDGNVVSSGSYEKGENRYNYDVTLSEEGSHNWKVDAKYDGEVLNSKSASFEADYKEDETAEQNERFKVFGPKEGISGYEASFRFDVNNTGLGADKYRVFLDGERFFSGDLNDGTKVVSKEKIITDEGSHEWLIKAVKNGEVLSESSNYSFSTSKDAPNIEFSSLSPADGASITGYEAEFKIGVDSPYDYRIKLNVDGDMVFNRTLHKDQNPSDFVKGLEESGEHTWEVEATAISTGEKFSSDTRTFSTSEDAPFANIDLLYPDDGASGDPGGKGISFRYEAEVFEQAQYEFVLNGAVNHSKSLEPGKYTFEKLRYLSEGSYDWYINVTGSGRTVMSEVRSLEVE